jgi:hypothetical protein
VSGFPRLHPRLAIRHWLEGDDVAYWPKADELDDAIGRQLSRVHRTCSNVAATAALVQSEAGDHAKFVVTGIASAYLFGAMKIRPLSTGFVIPAQPVKASKPPVGTAWVQHRATRQQV